MSSLASAPPRPETAQAPPAPPAPRHPPQRADVLLAAATAAGAVALGFVTSGEATPGANTWTEIVLVLAGAAAVGWLIVRRVRLRRAAAAAVAAFGAIALLSALSVAWSVVPDQSWVEASRTVAYLAAFVAAVVAARLAPARWPALLGAIAVSALALSAWAVLAKVFTLGVNDQVHYGRMLAPFGYWNATGLAAALGLPPLLWAGSHRVPRPLRALAPAGVTLLISVILLSYSRSALAAAVAGVAVVLASADGRLQAVLTLALGGAGAAVVCSWALSDGALTADSVAHGQRLAAGHALGIVAAVVLVAVAGAGWIAARAGERVVLPAPVRRRVGLALIVLAALVPVAGIGALAHSSRGLTGEVSHIWHTLTSPSGYVGDHPGRLVDLSNTRPRYWRQGVDVGRHHLAVGAGADAFGVAHLRYPSATLTFTGVEHAHSYVIQTFADLGLVGIALNVLLLGAWAAAARAPLRRQAAGASAERDALWALVGVAVAFGVSSAVDWTWFYPGVALPAVVAAGWVAGRGRLAATSQATARPVLSARPLALLGLTATAVAALVLAWAIWQPLRAADAVNGSIRDAVRGDTAAALTAARAAHAEDPLALEPLQAIASVQLSLGHLAAARAALVQGTTTQPENPAAWLALGEFDLRQAHAPARALHSFGEAGLLDRTDPTVAADIALAQSELAGRTKR